MFISLSSSKKSQSAQPASESAPVTSSQLRSTVPTDEDDTHDALDAITHERHTLANELDTANKELAQRDAEVERIKREMRAQRDAMMDEKLQADDRITSLTARMARKEDEYKSLMHTHLTTQADARQQTATSTASLADVTTRMSALQARYDVCDAELRDVQVEVMERRQAAKKGVEEMDAKWGKTVQGLKVCCVVRCMCGGWMVIMHYLSCAHVSCIMDCAMRDVSFVMPRVLYAPILSAVSGIMYRV